MLESDPVTTRGSRLFQNIIDPKLTSGQVKAMKMYFKYLDNRIYAPALIENWLHNVSNLVNRTGCRVLIMSVFNCDIIDSIMERFPGLDYAKGDLMQISYYEMIQGLRDRDITNDARCNHLTPPNHRILADKIYDWYDNRTRVDLSQDFIRDIINWDNLGSPGLFATDDHRVGFK